jgi:GntR family histidine utilization transcriptional repressor
LQPLYEKVKKFVTSEIANGQWQAGARVPSENELVQRLGVSRMTVNRALRELTQAGLIQRIAGVGTFVAPPRLQRAAVPVRDIAEVIEATGALHDTQVEDRQTLPADEAMAQIFAISPGTFLYKMTAVHLANGKPMMIEDRWINPAVAPDFQVVDLEQMTATRYLLDTAPLQRVEQTIEAVLVTDEANRLLALAPGEPVLLLRRRTWASDQVASYAQLYHAGTRFALSEWADDLPRVAARFKKT